jgi:hypothetical protein
MKLELKTILPYVVLIATVGMTWGMWSERLNAVEKKADSVAKIKKADSVAKMQQDIAVIKEKILLMDDRVMWIEEFLIKTIDY